MKVGQYLLNPMITGGALGATAGLASNLDSQGETDIGKYASNGAVLGLGVGALFMARNGYKNYKVGTYTEAIDSAKNMAKSLVT